MWTNPQAPGTVTVAELRARSSALASSAGGGAVAPSKVHKTLAGGHPGCCLVCTGWGLVVGAGEGEDDDDDSGPGSPMAHQCKGGNLAELELEPELQLMLLFF